MSRCKWEGSVANPPAIRIDTEIVTGGLEYSSAPGPGTTKLSKKQLKSIGLKGKGDEGVLSLQPGENPFGSKVVVSSKKSKVSLFVTADWVSRDAPDISADELLRLAKAAVANYLAVPARSRG